MSRLNTFLPCLPIASRVASNVVSVLVGVLFTACAQHASAAAEAPKADAPGLPDKLVCNAIQTAGLHDYDGAPEAYEPSEFFESRFELRINKVLTRHLSNNGGTAEATPDLFLTLVPRDDPAMELRCRQIRGALGEKGFSCSNTPPSEMLLINPATLRFTRSSVAGWTFSDQKIDRSGQLETPDSTVSDSAIADVNETRGHLGDDSLFVEYGNCEAR